MLEVSRQRLTDKMPVVRMLHNASGQNVRQNASGQNVRQNASGQNVNRKISVVKMLTDKIPVVKMLADKMPVVRMSIDMYISICVCVCVWCCQLNSSCVLIGQMKVYIVGSN